MHFIHFKIKNQIQFTMNYENTQEKIRFCSQTQKLLHINLYYKQTPFQQLSSNYEPHHRFYPCVLLQSRPFKLGSRLHVCLVGSIYFTSDNFTLFETKYLVLFNGSCRILLHIIGHFMFSSFGMSLFTLLKKLSMSQVGKMRENCSS